MHIGIDARFYGSLGKGLGRYTQKLIEHLETIDAKNRYTIFLRRENFDEYQPKNANFQKVLADYRWYSFAEQCVFPFVLLRYRLDMMHFPHFNVPFLYRRKFVVTIHDLILLHFPTQRATTLHPLWYRLKFAAYKKIIRFAVERSFRILTVSEYTKRDIFRHYPVSFEKIVVTYEAADDFCRYASPRRTEEILHAYGLTREKKRGENRAIIPPYLLYVGNAYPHKNLERLMDAVNRHSLRQIRLVLVGKEDYFYRRLKTAVKKKGIKNVFFVGFVPDGDLDVLYRFATAYVFPSLYEGFGLPPLEAMTRGLPVAVSESSCLPEVLGDAALFFDATKTDSLEAALRRISDDVSLRHQLREKGYARAAHFSWRSMAKATLHCYEA